MTIVERFTFTNMMMIMSFLVITNLPHKCILGSSVRDLLVRVTVSALCSVQLHT